MRRFIYILLSILTLPIFILGQNNKTSGFYDEIIRNDTSYPYYHDDGREIAEIWKRKDISLILFEDSSYEIFFQPQLAVNLPLGYNPRVGETNLILSGDVPLSNGFFYWHNDTLILNGKQNQKNFVITNYNPNLIDSISILIDIKDSMLPQFGYSKIEVNLSDNNCPELEITHHKTKNINRYRLKFPNLELSEHKLKNLIIDVGIKEFSDFFIDIENPHKNSIFMIDNRSDSAMHINEISLYIERPYSDFDKKYLVMDDSLIPINRLGSNFPIKRVAFSNETPNIENYRAIYLSCDHGRRFEKIYSNRTVEENTGELRK